MMKIDWTGEYEIDPGIQRKMQEAADHCPAAEGIDVPVAISVRLCDDEAISAINAEYRGISRSTDVLSFPTVEYPAGRTAGQCGKLLQQEYDDELNACFLGDIVIAVPHIFAQAAEYGHSPEREAAYLLVHGICHLMGYDHMEEGDKAKMRRMEEKVLSEVSVLRETGITDADRELVQAAVKAMEKSYSPYSGFPVGAAIRGTDGRVFTGCNIENVSFGLTNCAERTAVFKAVSEGTRSFDAIAIAANQTPWPCGACRQVLAEFAPAIRILLCSNGQVIEKNLSELLPFSIELETKESEK